MTSFQDDERIQLTRRADGQSIALRVRRYPDEHPHMPGRTGVALEEHPDVCRGFAFHDAEAGALRVYRRFCAEHRQAPTMHQWIARLWAVLVDGSKPSGQWGIYRTDYIVTRERVSKRPI